MTTYAFVLDFIDATRTPICVRGSVDVDQPSDLKLAVHRAQQQAFEQMTNGDTTFGVPGAGRCRGPYTLQRVELTRV